MDTTTNAANNGANAASAVATPLEQRQPTPPAVDGAVASPLLWMRVADLARDCDRDPRRVRELVAELVPDAQQERRSRPGGGKPELWVTAAGAERVRAALATPGPTAAATAEPTPGNAASNAAAVPTAADQRRATAAAVGPALLLEALRESHARELATLRAAADSLRAERDCARVDAQEARRRAEEAERGREAARAERDALRAAWWRWYALASVPVPWWRRRRLPDPPAELTSGPALPPPAPRV